MARQVRRHATAASARHEGALDPDFKVGQRVRTLDGYVGRIVEVSDSFAPGNTAYQVLLDNGAGGGTYLASQLRPIPGSYRAPATPSSNLPAGVTAALEAEADLDPHTADRDYPELGTVLQDRPDPASQVTVLGSKTAASYAEGHDARDDDYNGEPDLGIYWEAPAQQQWRDENLDEPEAPEGPEVSQQDQFAQNVMARLHGEPVPFPRIEGALATLTLYRGEGSHDQASYYPRSGPDARAGAWWTSNLESAQRYAASAKGDVYRLEVESHEAEPSGAPGNYLVNDPAVRARRVLATTMSGRPGTSEQAIDGHGDAPDHGSNPENPRAAEPDAYDDTSTEGQGDSKWSEPMPDVDKRDANGAQIGMYPEGMSGGDGPGLSIGGFTAHVHEARVPWTGEQRTELHGWDNQLAASAGDFVPSTNFTSRHPREYQEETPADEVVERELQATASVEDDPRWHLIHEHGFTPQDITDFQAQQLHDYAHQHGMGHSRPWELHRTTPGQQEPYDENRPATDISSGWGVEPEDVATPGQHAGDERRHYVMHTLSSLSGADLARHVQEMHGWDRGLTGDLASSGGLEIEHHAEHENAAGNVHITPAERGLCAYVHNGACAWPGAEITRTGESLRHSRPRWLTTRLDPLDDTDPVRSMHVDIQGHGPTHAIRAFRGSTHIGDLHFEQSDDGRAVHVTQLHSTKAGGQGVASAMMDDLYSHANRQGAWVDHGWRKQPGLKWWNSYSEPHPELSTHNAQPDEPMRANPLHPGGASWSHYFAPTDVASDMQRNKDNDQAGRHPEPHFDHLEYPFDPHNEMWRQARPRPTEMPDGKLDDLAAQHRWTEASLQAQGAYSDSDWADHLRAQHGYDNHDITHAYYQHGRLDDLHEAIHDAGLADHDHLEAAEARHEQALTDRFGEPIVPGEHPALKPHPGFGGRMPGDPMHSMFSSETPHMVGYPDPARHPHIYSSLEAEAANRRRADEVYGQLASDFPHDAISWVHDKGVRWHGPYDADPSEIDWDGRNKWAAYNQPQKVSKSAEKAQKKREKGKDPKPAIGTQGPGEDRMRVQDGHHRALGALVSDQPLSSYVAQVPGDKGPWDEMHSKQFTGGDTGKQRGPDGTDEERAEFQDQVESKVSRIESDRDSLDHGEAPVGQEEKAPPQAKAKGKGSRPPVVPRQKHDNQQVWPLATAPVQDGYPALSEGTHSQPKHLKNKLPLQLPGQEPGGDEEPEAEKKPSKKDKKAALAAFTAAAASESFRFEFTASWKDVLAKASRIRKAGRVRIVHASPGMVIGEVGGDHDVYESGIQRPPARPQTIQHWACGCPWASFRQDKSLRGRLNGRPCSHVMALQLESTARGGSRGQDILRDPHLPELGLPRHDVVVKSMPPWGAGGWAQTWLAPAASLHKTAEMFCPACGDDRDQLGQCYGCGLVSQDPRDSGGPDPDTPEGKTWVEHHIHAARILLDTGEKLTDVEALARAAGIHLGDLASSQKLNIRHLTVAHGIDGAKIADWRQRGQGPDVMHYRLHQAGAAMVLPHDHRRDKQTGEMTGPVSLRQEAAANDPWGDNNYAAHPPQKPYGATSPPERDMDPGSYGPLAGPDPDNWGEIEETGLQQPLSNEAAWIGPVLSSPQDRAVAPTYQSPPPRDLDYPAVASWQSEDGSSFPYVDQSSTAGPSTSAEPRDPQGIRMEESSDPDRAEYIRHLTLDHAAEPDLYLHTDYAKHERDHADMAQGGWEDHPYQELAWERRHGRDQWPDASSSHDFIASAMSAAMSELRTEPEPALPETTADEPMALDSSATGGGPGMSPHDESLTPGDYSIQTMGTQQAGAGEDSSGDLAFSVSPQESGAEGYSDDPVAQFQATAAARSYTGDGAPQGDGDIAAAAREYLAKTADVLPQAEADELIREGRGERARNLGLLQLEGTHYTEADQEMSERGLSLDHFDDDLALL